ncbi:MAG: response regulator [Clostridiales bacterium]|nr:response regulator [Clostridiales bacterium]
MNILVVDDSHFNLSLAKRNLEDMPEISQILLCDDPRQVTAILDEYDIDILITDLVMPALTGLDLLKLLRSNKKYDDIPIIIFNTIDDMDTYKECFEHGAFDYINKPINTVELHARLKVAIEAKKSLNNLKALLEVTKRQNEELKEINAQLSEAKFNLVQSEKMAAIGQLAAGVAHEINNPMGYISSNFEVLQKHFSKISEFLALYKEKLLSGNLAPSEESVIELNQKFNSLNLDFILEDVNDIFTETKGGLERISDIVNSLRIYARSDKGDEKGYHSLQELLHQAILITNNEVKYVAKIALVLPKDIIIYCNRNQLSQVFINLIVNAAQAIKSQNRISLGKITIKALQEGNNIRIEIADDGPGIPEENLTKIFEPFFTTKEVGQGTGLGLSIAYDIIVNKHGGKITAESTPGKGASFILILPAV